MNREPDEGGQASPKAGRGATEPDMLIAELETQIAGCQRTLEQLKEYRTKERQGGETARTSPAYEKGQREWTEYCKAAFDGRTKVDRCAEFLRANDVSRISDRELAGMMGVSAKTVARAKAKAGIAPPAVGRPDGMTVEERRLEIVRLRGEGLTQTEIAGQLGVSQSTVSETLRRFGGDEVVDARE